MISLKVILARSRVQGECLIWLGARNNKGYGMIFYKGMTMTVHRFMYQAVKGPIPDGMQVMHTCDVRNCINPEHLKVGTNMDNLIDMRRKCRGFWISYTGKDNGNWNPSK